MQFGKLYRRPLLRSGVHNAIIMKMTVFWYVTLSGQSDQFQKCRYQNCIFNMEVAGSSDIMEFT
jgi:hypothetical protein